MSIYQNIILFFIFLFFVLNCKTHKKEKKTSQEIKIDSTFFCLQDSITKKVLSKISYKKAKQNCRLTLLDREFILGEYPLIGIRVELRNFFSKEQINSKTIVIKEVKWETKNGEDFIKVWYKKQNNNWIPIEAYQYHKTTKF